MTLYALTPVAPEKEYDYKELALLTAELLDLSTARLKRLISRISNLRQGTYQQKALLKWNIYLGTLVVDYAESIIALVGHSPRAMQILDRCVFELVTKAKYFALVPRDAAKQYGSLDAKMFAAMSALPLPNEAYAEELRERKALWENSNPQLSQYDGERKFRKMFETVARDNQRKGSTDDELYSINYAIPSAFVHGDAVTMEDVLPHVRQLDNFEFRFESGTADTLQELGRASSYVWTMICDLSVIYKAPYADVHILAKRGQLLQKLDLARRKKARQPFMEDVEPG
jgi:hypothetical protein